MAWWWQSVRCMGMMIAVNSGGAMRCRGSDLQLKGCAYSQHGSVVIKLEIRNYKSSNYKFSVVNDQNWKCC